MTSSASTLLLLSVASTLSAADDLAAMRAHNTFFPPFLSGTWFVGQGGDTPNVNDHMALPEQAFGVDLVLTVDRSLASGDGTKVSDFYSYGQVVVSPCDGTVIEVENARPDNQIGKTDEDHEFGNHVIIDAGKNEYVVLAHFKPGSLTVAVHDHLTPGKPIALVGFSGNTTEPHLHMHIQDSPLLRHGHGLLFTFTGVTGTISGTQLENHDVPLIRGEWLKR